MCGGPELQTHALFSSPTLRDIAMDAPLQTDFSRCGDEDAEVEASSQRFVVKREDAFDQDHVRSGYDNVAAFYAGVSREVVQWGLNAFAGSECLHMPCQQGVFE